MLRITGVMLLSLLALSTACSSDNLAGSTTSAAANKSFGTPLPAGGSCSVNLQFGPNDVTHVPLPQATLTLAGDCNLKHLGATTMTATQWLYAYPDFENTTTYTAANGDQVQRFVGTLTTPATEQNNLTFTGTETVLGGTGRFYGASGSAALTGSATLSLGTGQYTTVGTIRY